LIFLYYAAVFALLAVCGPFLLLSPKARAGLSQKLGIVPHTQKGWTSKAVSGRPRIWFHAVSVGEFNALWSLLEPFRAAFPGWDIFISTTTATGQSLAQERAGGFAHVFHFPLDLPWATAAFLDAIEPDAIAVVETEIWPGFLAQCQARGIKTLILNGRLSPKSFRWYSTCQALFGPVFRSFNAIVAQSTNEVERYRAVAGAAARAVACGNIKFDGLVAVSPERRQELINCTAIKDSDMVLVAGSTHEGEESTILKAVQQLRHAKYRVIIAPRHPERFARVAGIIESYGFRVRRFSLGERFEQDNDVYLLDTIGQLTAFYSVASVAFVGGTLVPIGGHNLVEPATYGVPVVCGPHVHKTRDVAASLLEAKALIKIEGLDALIRQLEKLSEQPNYRSSIGDNGRLWLQKSQGAVKRTLDVLKQVLDVDKSQDHAKSLSGAGNQGDAAGDRVVAEVGAAPGRKAGAK
jgi:3-deoxy-D-manno-octulosonic-acid transferase